jgi:superfamily II DNA or RNA helicase
MVSTGSPLRKALGLILGNLVEEHPLFRLKYFGYEAYIHQAELFYKLAVRHPIRALIADEIGIGKTIEALLLVEWGLRKKVFPKGRVLILVPRSIIGQWRAEATRMGLHPITDIEHFENFIAETGESRVVFIFKIDTAKRDEYSSKLLKHDWDLIVVDEAHRLGLDTQRLRLVKELVKRNPNASVILLSATPHKGDDEHYLQLLSLLDSLDRNAVLGREDFYHRVIDALVFRRSKKHVNEVYEESKVFVDAELLTLPISPAEDERRYIEELDRLTRDLIMRCRDEKLRYAVGLLAMIIDKRGLSSPHAGLKTFSKILNSIKQGGSLPGMRWRASESLEDYIEEEYVSGEELDTVVESALGEQMRYRDVRDVVLEFGGALESLIKLAHVVQMKDSKLASLQKVLERHLDEGKKVIVFTEFADTADYIYNKLDGKLNYEIMKITGRDLGPQGGLEALENVKKWLSERGPRVLISTDVASEGLNLQYASVVINFELPWSLVKLEQRTGRVWRLGQQNDVKIYLMVLNHSFEEKIFNALYRKLASSVRAQIIPSTLVALKSRDGLELPVSGVFEFKNITPYKLWESYKIKGENGIAELVEEYLKELKRLGETLRKVKLYYTEPPSHPVIFVVKARLEKVTGFTGKNDLHKFLCDLVGKLGEPYCDDYTIDRLLKEGTRHVATMEPLHMYCDNISEPIAILKACASVHHETHGTCLLYAYQAGRIQQIKDFVKVIEKLASCEEMGRGLTSMVLKHYEKFLEDMSISVSSYLKREVLQSILREYLEYLEYTKGKGLRKGMFLMEPVNVDKVKVGIYPIMVLVPKDIVRGFTEEVKESIVREVDEIISVGDITEEKLEVEAQGREVLERVLGNRYELTYIGDTKAPYDYIARDRKTGEMTFIELKTLRKQKFIIYTENERVFAERVLNKYRYWLYVVDLLDRQIRGYANPFTTGKLKLVAEGIKGKYYVYEEIGQADEVENFEQS